MYERGQRKKKKGQTKKTLLPNFSSESWLIPSNAKFKSVVQAGNFPWLHLAALLCQAIINNAACSLHKYHHHGLLRAQNHRALPEMFSTARGAQAEASLPLDKLQHP